MRSTFRTLIAGAAFLAIVGAPAPAGDRYTPVSDLTPEEANRPAEEWTRIQVEEKGWTPYECFGTSKAPRAPVGTRWPMNDGPGNAGTCVTYSFMACASICKKLH